MAFAVLLASSLFVAFVGVPGTYRKSVLRGCRPIARGGEPATDRNFVVSAVATSSCSTSLYGFHADLVAAVIVNLREERFTPVDNRFCHLRRGTASPLVGIYANALIMIGFLLFSAACCRFAYMDADGAVSWATLLPRSCCSLYRRLMVRNGVVCIYH